MNRGWNRCPIFSDTGDRFLLLKTFGESVERFKIKIHAFSLMPNHYHLLIETPLGNLSRAMQYIDGVYTQRFNRKYNRDGSLFRGRFKSILIQKDSYFLEVTRYIHMNGTKAKLISGPEKDPYASHQFYLHPQKAPAWLETSTVFSYFDPDPKEARDQFHRFVIKEPPHDIDNTLSNPRWPAILGNKKFKKWIRTEFVENNKKPLDTPQDRPLRQKLSPNEVINQIVKIYHTDKALIQGRYSSYKNEARQATMIFLRTYSLLSYTEIGALLGGVTYGAISPVCRKGETDKSPLFFKVKAQLDKLIKYQL
ncbi:hypothetical protein BVX98_03870 [bacterium F11]|nr:hypothetical protein BVX98_03870 [bacterium F11]